MKVLLINGSPRMQGNTNRALEEVAATGYGIVMPSLEELVLEEPEIVKQGGRYGVRLRASAPSIHNVCSKQRHGISSNPPESPLPLQYMRAGMRIEQSMLKKFSLPFCFL